MVNAQLGERRFADGTAVVSASVFGGLVFLSLFSLLLPMTDGGSASTVQRWIASAMFGESILPPPTHFSALAFFGSLLLSLLLALSVTTLSAFVFHRFGVVVGLFGGAASGVVHFAFLYLLWPLFSIWWGALLTTTSAAIFAIAGSVCGILYEVFEEEREDVEVNRARS